MTNEELTKKADQLDAAKAQISVRRGALNAQIADLKKQMAQYEFAITQILANINAVEGALSDVNFWEEQLNTEIIEDKAVVDQLLRNQE